MNNNNKNFKNKNKGFEVMNNLDELSHNFWIDITQSKASSLVIADLIRKVVIVDRYYNNA